MCGMWQMPVSCPSILILPQPMAHGTHGGGRALMTILRALRQQLLINKVKLRFLTLMTLSPVLSGAVSSLGGDGILGGHLWLHYLLFST